MNERHWERDRLIDHLYGIVPADPHLEGCVDCSARLEEMRATRRSSVAAEREVGADLLVAQRQRIDARRERPRGWGFGLAQALGVAVTLLMAVLLSTPSPGPGPTITASTAAVVSLDAELFAEIAEMVESTEARAAAPIHALFVEEMP
jgi:hypothetical protein